MRNLFGLLAAATSLALFLTACEGERPSLDEAIQAASDAAGKVSEFVDNLDPKKVEELAKLAAELEKSPERAQELLEKHGIDRKQFDEAMKKIESDPNLRKLFDKAKEIASK